MVKRRQRRRVRRPSRGTISETVVTKVKIGKNTLTAEHLTNTPHNSCWRIVSVRAQLTYAIGTAAPVAIQTLLFNPTGQAVAASGVKLLGNQPRTISIRYPRGAEWFSPLSIAQPTTPVFQLDVICTGTASSQINDETIIGCILSMRVATKTEVVQTTCPSQGVLIHTPPDAVASSFESLSLKEV